MEKRAARTGMAVSLRAALFLITLILLTLSLASVAEAAPKYISNSASGGDCATIGVWNTATKTCTLTTDVIVSSGNGIEITGDGITLDGNGHTVSGGGGYATGGSVSVRNNVTVRNLNITGFKYGIYLMASSNSTFTGNTLAGNTYGLYVSFSNGSTICDNNFMGNATQAVVSGGAGNVFDEPAGGNYWSDYDTPEEGCIDGNGDLLCDSPYTFSGGQDNRPWTAPRTGAGGITVGRPALKLLRPASFWDSYAHYLARDLSVTWTVANTGTDPAYGVRITGSDNSQGVTLLTTLPVLMGDIAGGASAGATVRYDIPPGVSSWLTTTRASAADGAGTVYTYP